MLDVHSDDTATIKGLIHGPTRSKANTVHKLDFAVRVWRDGHRHSASTRKILARLTIGPRTRGSCIFDVCAINLDECK